MNKLFLIKGVNIIKKALLVAFALIAVAGSAFAVTDKTWIVNAGSGQVAAAGNCRYIAYYKGSDNYIQTEDSWNAVAGYVDSNAGYVLGGAPAKGWCDTNSTYYPDPDPASTDTYDIWISSIADAQAGHGNGTVGASSPFAVPTGNGNATPLALAAGIYLAEPGSAVVAAGNGRTYLNWSAVTGATGYKVYRGPVSLVGSGAGIYQKVADVATLYAEDSTLTNGTTYYYIVVAYATTTKVGVHTNQVAATPTNDATVPSITPPLNPISGVVGSTVIITGTNFGGTQGTGNVYFNGTAAATADVTSWANGSITVKVPTGATTGSVYVVNPSNKASNGVAFTVTIPGVPDITSCSPARYAGDTSVTMSVVGTDTNFVNGITTATVNPATGVTVNSVTVSNTTNAVINVTIASGTTAGSRGITLTTTTEVATGEGLFVITAPSFASVTPTSGYQGDTITGVAIVGTGTHFTGTPTVSFSGSNITASSVVVSDATHLTCTVAIAASAAVGARNVSVTTGSETVTGTSVFTVNAPSFTSVTPNSGAQGAALTGVAIVGTGTHFTGTPTVNFGSNITVSNVAVSDATHLTCNLAISTEATLGARTVEVTTGGETVTGTGVFTVTPVSTSGQLIYERAGGIMMAYPNPFNPNDKANPLKMLFNTATGEAVDIYIFDTNARIIYQRRDVQLAADREARWDGETSYGEAVENGLYLIRIVNDGKLVAKGKILVIKK